jgi:hypothetical protein
MSHPVRERLVGLATDVEHVRLAPAATVRARGRSRARRRWAGTAAALATVVAAAGFGLTSAGGNRTPVATLPAVPSPACPVPADLTLPGDPGEVVINVVGGGNRVGQVTVELRRRGFAATGREGGDPDADRPGPVAILRYGPRAIGSATVVRALVDGDVVMTFLPDRESRSVDLALGSGFRRLASVTQMNQKLVAAGEPTRPPGC